MGPEGSWPRSIPVSLYYDLREPLLHEVWWLGSV